MKLPVCGEACHSRPVHRLTPLAIAIAALLAVLVPVGLTFVVLRQNAQKHDLERFETGLRTAELALHRENARMEGFLPKLQEAMAVAETPAPDLPVLAEWRKEYPLIVAVALARKVGGQWSFPFEEKRSVQGRPPLWPPEGDTYLRDLREQSVTRVEGGRWLVVRRSGQEDVALVALIDGPEMIRRAYAEAGERFFTLNFSTRSAPTEDAPFRRRLQSTVLEYPASFIVNAGPRFWRQSQQVMASIVFGAGAILALALGAVGWALARQRIELADRVAERTEELRAANEKLTLAVAREQELNALKTSFVSMVSHELRTPMQIIQSSAELLDRYHERLSAEQRDQHFQSINGAIVRVANLTEEVLLFSRLEAARLALELKPFDLDAWLPTLAAELEAAHAERGPVKITGRLDGEIQADERLLRHILGNVLGNALKYSPAKAPVDLEVSRDGADVVFLVTDRGIGIPAEDQSRLFVSFHRGENARHLPGTGLGLVIVKRCVELHRGRITLTSQPGEGTTVSIRLPLPPL